IARSFKPDVVVASGPPFGIFEGARRVAAEMTVPLVLDMRDPWVDPLRTRLPSLLAYRWARDIQRRSLSAADLTIVTAPTLQGLLESLPIGRPRRVVTITNGFDSSAPATEAARAKGRSLVRMDGVRTVAFVGRLFATQTPTPSPARKWADQAFELLA